jgi:hypothetical protein
MFLITSLPAVPTTANKKLQNYLDIDVCIMFDTM